jgi:hypothetical protein
MAKDLPPTQTFEARRCLVVTDLGHVNKGDHVLLFGDVIVGVDTSRRPSDPIDYRHVLLESTIETPRPSPFRTGLKKKTDYPDTVVHAMDILNVIAEHQPIGAKDISDRLNIDRKDVPARAKVTKYLGDFKVRGQIKTDPNSPYPRVPLYVLANVSK